MPMLVESLWGFLRYRISRARTVRRDTEPAAGTMTVGRSGVIEM